MCMFNCSKTKFAKKLSTIIRSYQLLKNKDEVQSACRTMGHTFLHTASLHKVLVKKKIIVEYKDISTSIIFMEYFSLCAMLPWITPASAREAFILHGQ